VLVLDVTEEEAKKLLATIDPLAAMAQEDEAAKHRLLSDLDVEEAGLKKLIAEMLAAIPEDEAGEGKAGNALGGPVEMELRPHEHYDYVIVLASNTHEWNRLVELLNLQTVRRRGRVGAARGVRAPVLISLLERAHGNAKDRNPE
jgi:hypothetical protein